MGSSQSILTASEITDAPRFSAVASNNKNEEHFASSKNGPKTQPIETNLISLTDNTVEDDEETLSVVSTTTTESDDDDDDYDSSDDEEDDELDEFIAERKRVLADANDLKQLAMDYFHPEKSVVATEPTVFARNYFGRASAPTKYDDDDNFLTTVSRARDDCVDRDMEEERVRILKEAAEMKKIAEWYHMPNKPIATTDALAGASNYFSRVSVSTKYDDDDNFLTTMSRVRDDCVDRDMEEERERILEEAAEMKKIAEWYHMPNKPIATTDALAGASNYFSRVSIPGCDDDDERERILQEAAELKKVADWHLHAYKKVAVDPAVFGRNFFSSSAPEEIVEDESKRILEDVAELKKVADWYLHPEKKIELDPAVFGRNFFSSTSEEDTDLDDEHERVLEEAVELKKVADWYLHPEKKIEVDPAAYGRNYFGPTEDEDGELDDERELVLNELSELKKVADWHLHPEKKIEVDPAACGRNYFGLSEQDDDDELDDERERVLEEVSKLKKVAGWYLHPENKIEVDPAIFGRNYFGPSVHDDDDELVEERERVLEEVSKLKKVAGWHLYPESKIDVDPTTFARNYYSLLAPVEDDLEEEGERVLAEAVELKKVAGWYLHPEKPVASSSINCASNYFKRAQVTEKDDDDLEERERVLEEVAELKKIAIDYFHPEKPVVPSSVNCSRNYFNRAFAKGDHSECIQTQGYANHPDDIEQHYVMHDDDYHQDDYHHHDDISHSSFNSHGDHFDMDEDVFHGFRDSINAFRDSVIHDQQTPIIEEEVDGKEGNLSRSPSSIMLFEEPAM